MDIHIISGFLGSGKTTFINRYLPLLPGKTAVIQNESGEVPLDIRLPLGKVPVKELNTGCICCTLAPNLWKGIGEIREAFHPDQILIEPSGIGKLSEVCRACLQAEEKYGINLRLSKRIVMIDISSFEDDVDGFGQFYTDQIEWAELLFFTHMEGMSREEAEEVGSKVRRLNQGAAICMEDFRNLSQERLRGLMDMPEREFSREDEMEIVAVPGEGRILAASVLERQKVPEIHEQKQGKER